MSNRELAERYPSFCQWLRDFFYQCWEQDYGTASGLVNETVELFAGDRVQWVDDVRRFRRDFATVERQLAAAGEVEVFCNPDPVDFSLALSLIEEKFLEEIETGVDHRELLDDG